MPDTQAEPEAPTNRPVPPPYVFFPEHGATLTAQLKEAGLSRVYCRIQYGFDIAAGQALGCAVRRTL